LQDCCVMRRRSRPFWKPLMTETQERFLRTVLTRVPLESVVELHLFPPIRRGTLETGVAVIATVLPTVSLAVVDADTADAQAEVDVDPHADVGADVDEVELVIVSTVNARADDDSPYSDALAMEFEVREPAALAHSDETEVITEARIPVAAPRLRILTANYRHTIKGVERGKWAVDIQEEADAPLDALEAVLRGVRHRSTEPADPELVTHDTLAALLSPVAVAPAA
jgi:hypothetical protein